MEPGCDVKVVEGFELVLGARASIADRYQIDVVFEDAAEITERVRDAKLVAIAALDQSIPTKTNVDELRDRARVFVGK